MIAFTIKCLGEKSVCCKDFPTKKRSVIVVPFVKYLIEEKQVKGFVVGGLRLNALQYVEDIDKKVENLDEVDIGLVFKEFDLNIKILEKTLIEQVDKKEVEKQVKMYTKSVLEKLLCLELSEEQLRKVLELEFNQSYVANLVRLGDDEGEVKSGGIMF